MSEEALLTIRQLAAELHLPESTVRYYRDAFLDHIPSVGTGRRRRYPPHALAVLRSIADGYSAGRTRTDIARVLNNEPGAAARMVPVGSGRTNRAVSLDDVNNVDLLTAILDRDREQRDALWQMAREIVKLTQVLESHDRVLTEIAGRAGIAMEADRRLESGDTPSAGKPDDPSSMTRLRAELEAERALVDRLREAKLQLEQRAVDAEAALDIQKPKRLSLIARLLGKDSA